LKHLPHSFGHLRCWTGGQEEEVRRRKVRRRRRRGRCEVEGGAVAKWRGGSEV